MKDALKLIEEERKRQISVEGWGQEHDDSHRKGELAQAAACYAANDDQTMFHGPRKIFFKQNYANKYIHEFTEFWPWDKEWDKRDKNRSKDDRGISSRIRDLTKAGALIVAELERLQRSKGVSN